MWRRQKEQYQWKTQPIFFSLFPVAGCGCIKCANIESKKKLSLRFHLPLAEKLRHRNRVALVCYSAIQSTVCDDNKLWNGDKFFGFYFNGSRKNDSSFELECKRVPDKNTYENWLRSSSSDNINEYITHELTQKRVRQKTQNSIKQWSFSWFDNKGKNLEFFNSLPYHFSFCLKTVQPLCLLCFHLSNKFWRLS